MADFDLEIDWRLIAPAQCCGTKLWPQNSVVNPGSQNERLAQYPGQTFCSSEKIKGITAWVMTSHEESSIQIHLDNKKML
jgi:hypothetical protein